MCGFFGKGLDLVHGGGEVKLRGRSKSMYLRREARRKTGAISM